MKYEEKRCNKCNAETVHRVFHRYGKSDRKTGRKAHKRTVVWCMTCQHRVIKK